MEKSHVGMSNCYFCGQAGATILIDKRLRPTLEREVGVIDMEPCQECKGYMKQGVIVMSIADDTTAEEMKPTSIENRHGRVVGSNPPNPYRTGGWAVVKDEAIVRMTQNMPEYQKFALEKRFMFITSTAWNELGFEPRVTAINKGDKSK